MNTTPGGRRQDHVPWSGYLNRFVVADSPAGASGGCDMSISPSGWTFITFTNNTGDPWVERRAPGGSGGWERFPIG